jgi:hypothetical protein
MAIHVPLDDRERPPYAAINQEQLRLKLLFFVLHSGTHDWRREVDDIRHFHLCFQAIA